MHPLRFRQVHLDFHTPSGIDGVGADFDPENFREALTVGRINSITLFSKCCHGYSYHPTEVGFQHPGLHGFNLLGEELKVCRELGVNAPVYLNAGLDKRLGLEHPEWLLRPKPGHAPDYLHETYWFYMCFNTPYVDVLAAEVEEVMRMFKPTGVFLDICDVRTCYCHYCINSMKKLGLDPSNPDDVQRHGELVYENFCRRMTELVHKYDPGTNVYFNSGIRHGRRDLVLRNTHYELESLPTGGWGYDHFPMEAAYVRTLGMDYLSMTGKFHMSWGEFGGFKHPNALRYEAALALAFGAKCSVGDQMHPRGKMNMATYKAIGSAYEYVEKVEGYYKDAKPVTDIAILSGVPGSGWDSDIGANRILLEGKYLFDIVDGEADFGDYKLLILPDSVKPDKALEEKLCAYLAAGGKIFATGDSCIGEGGFIFDFGAKFESKNPYSPTYVRPCSPDGFVNGVTEYVMYEQAYNITATTGKVISELVDPYFSRTPEHYYAPDRPGNCRAGAVVTANTAYIAWKVFTDYAVNGELHAKELVLYVLQQLLPDSERSAVTDLPEKGIVTLYRQGSREIISALFASTSVSGKGIEVIRDVLPLYNVGFEVKRDKSPSRVYTAPEGGELKFEYTDGRVKFTLPRLQISLTIIIE